MLLFFKADSMFYYIFLASFVIPDLSLNKTTVNQSIPVGPLEMEQLTKAVCH